MLVLPVLQPTIQSGVNLMFEWKNRYNIGVELVDTEHKKLFDLLTELSDDVSAGEKEKGELDVALESLLEYANHHFIHEEELMEKSRIDPRHIKRQQMEHKSFFYDIEKLRQHSVDDKIKDRYERLLQFVMSWLVFHTLRTDQHLGIQLREISQGKSPEEAFDIAMASEFNVVLYRHVVEALIHLWSDAADRVAHLENVINSIGGKK